MRDDQITDGVQSVKNARFAFSGGWFQRDDRQRLGLEPVFSFRLMAPLVLAVLLVHLILLQGAALTLSPPSRRPGPVFNTRTVELVAERAEPRQIHVPPKAPSLARRRPRPVDLGSTPPAAIQAQVAEQPALTSIGEKDAGTAQGPPALQEAQVDNDQLALAPRPLRERIGSASAYAVPGSLNLKYQVTSNKFPFSLNAELGWQQDGESYSARLAFGAFGIGRVQTSRGQITPEGLAPLRFSDKYRSEVAAHFVRDKGKVTFSANTPDAPLLTGAQDRLSIVMQLGAMIAGDPDRFPPATTIAVQIVGPRAADIWLFTVENEEMLSLPGGQQLARKLVRNPRQEYDQKVELWLAPALGYLPVRMRITDSNGDFADQKWLASEAPG